MTDRELLELAAKAIGGVAFESLGGWALAKSSMSKLWNPLEDDGDALRLAVKLGDDIQVMKNKAIYSDSELCAATRRAIVRAAAEIGRKM